MSDKMIGLDLEMITPITFNTTYLNDRLSRFKKPLIHDSIEVPKGRAIHMNMLNDIEEENYESLEVLNTIERDRLVVHNTSVLHNPEGKFRFRKKNFSQYDMRLKRVFKKTKTIALGDNISVTNRDLMVFNYILTFRSYTYLTHRMTEWFKFKNSMSTLVATLNERAIFLHNLVLFDLPTTIPAISIMNRLADKEYSPLHIKAFPDNQTKLVFEFWKLFTDGAESIFDGINPEKRASIYFVFRHNDKYTMYNLRDIYALSKSNEMEDRGKIGPKGDREAAKLFLLSLKQFELMSTMDEALLKGLYEDSDDDDNDDVDDLLENIGISTTEDNVDDLIDKLEDINPEPIKEIEEVKDIVEERVKQPTRAKEVTKIGKTPEESQRILSEVVETATKNKDISKGENSRLIEVLDVQLDNKFKINNKEVKLKEILDYRTLDTKINRIPMRTSKTVLNTEALENNNVEVDRKYIKEVYHKDLYNSIYGVQKAGVVITDHIVEDNKTFLGDTEVHTISIKPLKGKPSTVKLILPKIDEEGVYKMSGNEYMLRKQRKDLPIRKTSPSMVLLTSYNGKLFIAKNLYQTDDPSGWLSKQIANNDNYTNVIFKKNNPFDLSLSKFYTNISRSISRFKYNKVEYIFDYKNRLSSLNLEDGKKIKDLEKKLDAVFVGGKDTYYFLNKKDEILKVSKGEVVNTVNAVLHFELDTSKQPIEFISVRVLSKYVPLGVILLYYLGLTEILKRTNTKLRYYTTSERYKLEANEFKIPLDGGILVFDRNDSIISLIISGLNKEVSKLLTIEDLDSQDGLENMVSILGITMGQINAIKSMETLFIDNITQSTLEEMGEPTDLHGLLFRATEMLVDDNYKNPNNITDNALVRYERIPGLVYKTLSRSVQSYNNRSGMSKAAISVDPFEVWRAIGDDSTSMLLENNNPIATIKQRDNVTYLGEFGRSRITLTIPTRIMTDDEVGIISEATPDSGDSGISTYLTHSASISNVRGMVKPIDASKFTIAKALSTANSIHPFITNDDSKRANFASIQSSHMIPMKEMKSLRVWTGVESVIANKVGKPFVYVAEDNGRVTKLTNDSITIKYEKAIEGNDVLLLSDIEDNSIIREVYNNITAKGYNVVFDINIPVKHKVYIGKSIEDKSFIKVMDGKFIASTLKGIKPVPTKGVEKSYSLRSWSSKVEGNVSIKQSMTTNLRLNELVEKDQAIVYNSSFFEPNIYDNKSIVFRMGSFVNCIFIESKATYEDSIAFNSKILEKTGETTYKVLSKVVDVNSHITNVLGENSTVSYGDKLMTIIDSSLVSDTTLTDRAREILSEASDSSPKASANGIIERIDVIYNCNLEDMDSSVRALADKSNKRFMSERGSTGQVTSEYSIRGVPLREGEIELKYYIVHDAVAKIGDKFVLGHQLKNTVGDILDDIKTESGEQVDVIFSVRSVAARITNSSYILGTTNALMKHFTNKAINAYRSK